MTKKYVFTKKRQQALNKNRKKWQNKSKRARAKAMPGGKGRIKNR